MPTIKDRFKAHVFIDGVYKNWPLTDEQKKLNGLSTDGSREFIQGYTFDRPSRFKLLDLPYKTEYEKRSLYLDAELLIRELNVDAILIIDSDEYINEFNFEVFYDQLEHKIVRTHHRAWNVYGVLIQEEITEKKPFESYQSYPHLWYKPWDMIYKPQSHYQYINCRRELNHLNDSYSQIPIDTIEGIKITHDPNVRSPEYLEKKEVYEGWLRELEHQMEMNKFRSNLQE